MRSSNTDVTREPNDGGEDTLGGDTTEEDSLCIQNLFTTTRTDTHEGRAEDNGIKNPLKNDQHNPNKSCDNMANADKEYRPGKLDEDE